MLVSTVSQLLEMSDGSVPEAIKGKIVDVMRIMDTTKNDPNGYRMQKVVITDGNAQMQCVFDNRDEIPRTMIGAELYAVGYSTPRGRAGLKRKTYNPAKGAPVPQIWVFDKADVSFNGNAAPVSQPAREEAPPPRQHTNGHQVHRPAAQQPAPQAREAAPQAPTKSSSELRAEAMAEFDRRVAKTSAAFSRCFDAAVKLVDDVGARHGIPMPHSPELLEKIAVSILVNSCWTQKPADVTHFPLKPFQAYEVQPPAEQRQPVPQRAGAPFN